MDETTQKKLRLVADVAEEVGLEVGFNGSADEGITSINVRPKDFVTNYVETLRNG